MRRLALLLAIAVVMLACGRAELPPAGAAADPPADAAFLTIPLNDVRTGEQFTLGGFPGKVTFVLAMAVW